MNKIETFQQFLTTQSAELSVWVFLFNLVLAALFSFFLTKIYVHYGNSLSNRQAFAQNFIPMTMTTMVIITIVKSSLALSLGLVGALSIVRFRAAIKEPEELSYLFIAIALGLGFGASQTFITIFGFVFICAALWLKNRNREMADSQNLCLTIASAQAPKVELEQIVNILNDTCSAVNLKRFDESKDLLEASFLIEFDDFEQMNKTRTSLLALDENLNISFLDNKGIY